MIVFRVNLIKIFRLLVVFKIWSCFSFDFRELEKSIKNLQNLWKKWYYIFPVISGIVTVFLHATPKIFHSYISRVDFEHLSFN